MGDPHTEFAVELARQVVMPFRLSYGMSNVPLEWNRTWS